MLKRTACVLWFISSNASTCFLVILWITIRKKFLTMVFVEFCVDPETLLYFLLTKFSWYVPDCYRPDCNHRNGFLDLCSKSVGQGIYSWFEFDVWSGYHCPAFSLTTLVTFVREANWKSKSLVFVRVILGGEKCNCFCYTRSCSTVVVLVFSDWST